MWLVYVIAVKIMKLLSACTVINRSFLHNLLCPIVQLLEACRLQHHSVYHCHQKSLLTLLNSRGRNHHQKLGLLLLISHQAWCADSVSTTGLKKKIYKMCEILGIFTLFHGMYIIWLVQCHMRDSQSIHRPNSLHFNWHMDTSTHIYSLTVLLVKHCVITRMSQITVYETTSLKTTSQILQCKQ